MRIARSIVVRLTHGARTAGQRSGEGFGTRVSLAKDAAGRQLLDHRGDRRRCEHQPVLCQPGATHYAARAGDRGGDTGWHSACWID